MGHAAGEVLRGWRQQLRKTRREREGLTSAISPMSLSRWISKADLSAWLIAVVGALDEGEVEAGDGRRERGGVAVVSLPFSRLVQRTPYSVTPSPGMAREASGSATPTSKPPAAPTPLYSLSSQFQSASLSPGSQLLSSRLARTGTGATRRKISKGLGAI